MRFSKTVVKRHILIFIIALILLIPAVFGMVKTRVNYDMLDYLPSDMDTVIGQGELKEEFGKVAFSIIIVEDMPDRDVDALTEEIKKVDHVDSVLWYSSLFDLSIPKEMLPDKLYKAFNTDHSTAMAVFFDSGTSEDVTMDAVREIRRIAGKQCFVSGLSALVTDLKDLCEKEEPIYVALAVACALAAMFLLLDSWLVPLVFIASIGIMIVLNLGTNFFLGNISYITKALSAVLQLAVTMDYSIFLWNSYNEHRKADSRTGKEANEEAMTLAIRDTLVSVVGSSVTTIAGFIALCFMSFTLGRDLGIVMAKGVLLGVAGSVTVLPSMILILDKPLQKTRHKALIPEMHSFSEKLTRIYPVFLILFVALLIPFVNGYRLTNKEVYYEMGDCLPDYIEYVTAKNKLADEFDIASTHMLLVDSNVSSKDKLAMISEMEEVDGVKYVLGIDSLTEGRIPDEMLPEEAVKMLRSDKWELMMISSEYKVASDEVNEQVGELNTILKKYDEGGMLIGEAPCMKDMIETTGHDFKVVNLVSILAIFLIILIVEQSLSIPFILICVIELAIFINLGAAHYLGQSLPFIAPICISTIQLGATVDYAILMTTRYKAERKSGKEKKAAVNISLATSIPSIIVSGMGLFAATFGVAMYSDIDIIKSMCMLMARGAVISMGCVILILPAMLLLFDGVILKTTRNMKA
ncbi:MAG: MMPL family transporter [Blautia sp.]|nr:MMPL family transporter [Blautia sp.]